MVHRLGPKFEGVLAEHNRIMRAAIAESGGTEVGTDGDAVFAVFPTPTAGISAALSGQRGLRSHDWPDGGRVTVRMGIHTGEGSLGGDNYVGVDVNRAARIAAAAHGGQIVLSESTKALFVHSMPADVKLRELGSYRLKDLEHDETIFQVITADLPSDFPPLRTADVPTNLPAQHSEFVGRPDEVQEVIHLLTEHRLVTLTGAGGTGKTRLAVHVAGKLIDRFHDGVYFVALDAVDDDDQVPSVIAGTIGAGGEASPTNSIADIVGSRSMLLILDNFEHVLGAARAIASTLDGCPELRILVTSQSLLHLRDEHVYPVPPLGLPTDDRLVNVQASDSALLFVRRVWAIDPSFSLTQENAAAIAAIVSRLDGLPLAIELAASRVRLFGIAGLQAELDSRMSGLEAGFSDAPIRHQTLNNAIDWSYELLEPDEQVLLRRSSIFVGGFSLDAVEAVCSGPAIASVVNAMASLIDKSLVTSTIQAGTARFSILNTIRAFGRDQLANANELEEMSSSHAEYFTTMAGGGANTLRGPGSQILMERLVVERGNLTAAIEWSVEHDPEFGLAAMLVLARYFEFVGGLEEGRDLATRLLEAPETSNEVRLTGLLGAASIVYWLLDYPAAERLYDEAITLAEDIGDPGRLAETLFGLGYTYIWQGRLEEAEVTIDRAHAAFELAGDPVGMRRVLAAKGTNQWLRGDIKGATITWVSYLEGCRKQGDVAEEQAAELALGGVLLLKQQYGPAASAFVYVLERCQELGDDSRMIMALDYVAIAMAYLDPVVGVRLGGFVTAIKDRSGGSFDLTALGLGDPKLIAASTFNSEEMDHLLAEGRDFDLPEAVAAARDGVRRAGIEPNPIDVDLVLSREIDLNQAST